MAYEPDRIIVNFLRANLTDPNTGSRAGTQWIYPDFPRTQDLTRNSFPRIGITILSESSEYLGMSDNDRWDTINAQIDILTKKGLNLSVTTTDEAMGVIANDARLDYATIPNTVTNIKHNTTAFGTVTMKNTDDDFTAPGSLAAGTVEWSYATGNLNFSSADLASYSGQAITSTSVVALEGKKLVQYLARQVVSAFRTGWRTDTNLDYMKYPVKMSNQPVPFEEDAGIFRQMIEYRFNAVNAGED